MTNDFWYNRKCVVCGVPVSSTLGDPNNLLLETVNGTYDDKTQQFYCIRHDPRWKREPLLGADGKVVQCENCGQKCTKEIIYRQDAPLAPLLTFCSSDCETENRQSRK